MWIKTKISDKYKINKKGQVLGPSGKILKPVPTKLGYYTITLSLGNLKVIRKYIHILMAETFIGDIPENSIVYHIDNDKSNNKLSNLSIVTRSERGVIWAAQCKKKSKTKRKNNGYCCRGHKLDNKRSYCLQCRNDTKNGVQYLPPTNTVWEKSIVPEYLISQDGRVWSTYHKKIMTPGIGGSGYKYVCLSINKSRKIFTVHKLVANAFLGKVKKPNIIDHIDGNKLNNNVTNLRIVTNSQNISSSKERTPRSKNKYGPKLTVNDVLKIKNILKENQLTIKEIAKKFSVSISAISSIKNGASWSSVIL